MSTFLIRFWHLHSLVVFPLVVASIKRPNLTTSTHVECTYSLEYAKASAFCKLIILTARRRNWVALFPEACAQ